MKNKSVIVLIGLLSFFACPILVSAQIPQQIINGLKIGDAGAVAAHFNENIELVIVDQESVCSKAQGEQILKDFFSHNKPSDFKITHQGSEDSPYAIGKMQTSSGNFRVYFLLRSKGGSMQIVQLKIDKD